MSNKESKLAAREFERLCDNLTPAQKLDLSKAWDKVFREVKAQDPRHIIIPSESSLEMKIHGEWVKILPDNE